MSANEKMNEKRRRWRYNAEKKGEWRKRNAEGLENGEQSADCDRVRQAHAL